VRGGDCGEGLDEVDLGCFCDGVGLVGVLVGVLWAFVLEGGSGESYGGVKHAGGIGEG